MKTARRHELQHNQLADWLGAKIEEVAPYSRAIVAGIIAVLALIAVAMIYSKQQHSKEETAWTQYFIALDRSHESGFTPTGRPRNVQADFLDELNNVATKYSGQTAGSWARLTMGNIKLREGVEDLFRDRDSAKEQFTEAIENFDKVLAATNDPSLREQATLGIARTYEAQSKTDEARKKYEQMVKGWPNGIYIAEAKQRVEDLSKNSTKDFYMWFASQEMKPKSSHPFGGLDNIPGHPPMRSPGFPMLDDKPISLPRETPVTTDPEKTPATSDDKSTEGKKDGDEKKSDDKPATEKKTDKPEEKDAKPSEEKDSGKGKDSDKSSESAKEPEKK